MASTDDVLASVMALPARRRARLAYDLLQSLDEPADADAEAAWTAELAERVQDIRDDRVELVSLDEVKRRMAARRAERSTFDTNE